MRNGIRRLAMTYFLLSPKGIHGGESSLPKMRSILMMCRAEQCIAQLGSPLCGGATTMDGGSVNIEGTFIDRHRDRFSRSV
ncbi:hypothetical protein AYJ58_15555 [Shewanella sp. Pdp11]|nr:hypothetical protein AYJ58_15555 [Shewanella sp. Pdp11]